MDCSDTHLLLDGPELNEPRASSHIDDDDADEPRRLARTVADVLDTTARCTLRRQRTAVEVAIRPNRATVRRQQRVVAAAAPTGDPAQVLATLMTHVRRAETAPAALTPFGLWGHPAPATPPRVYVLTNGWGVEGLRCVNV